jgi:hypothetical protein
MAARSCGVCIEGPRVDNPERALADLARVALELHEAGGGQAVAAAQVWDGCRAAAAAAAVPPCTCVANLRPPHRAQARLELVQALQGSPAAKQVAVLFDLWDGDGDGRLGAQGGWPALLCLLCTRLWVCWPRGDAARAQLLGRCRGWQWRCRRLHNCYTCAAAARALVVVRGLAQLRGSAAR